MGEMEVSVDVLDFDAAEANEVLFQWMAHVLNKPIPIPDDDFVRNLALVIPELFAMDQDGSPAIEHFRSFLDEVQSTPDLGELQQRLAVDRTALFRGVSEAGVKPPYEEFYRSKGEGTMSDMNRIMRKAGLAPSESNRERVDYLGNELELEVYLSRRAREAGDDERAASDQELAEHLLFDHLARWVPRYCTTALPYAQTEFFRGFLLALKELFDTVNLETD